MRHARSEALDELEEVLARLRELPGLVEKRRGVFYRQSRAFLHFHEDVSGLHADVRIAEDFERRRVQTEAQRRSLLALVAEACEPQ